MIEKVYFKHQVPEEIEEKMSEIKSKEITTPKIEFTYRLPHGAIKTLKVTDDEDYKKKAEIRSKPDPEDIRKLIKKEDVDVDIIEALFDFFQDLGNDVVNTGHLSLEMQYWHCFRRFMCFIGEPTRWLHYFEMRDVGYFWDELEGSMERVVYYSVTEYNSRCAPGRWVYPSRTRPVCPDMFELDPVWMPDGLKADESFDEEQEFTQQGESVSEAFVNEVKKQESEESVYEAFAPEDMKQPEKMSDLDLLMSEEFSFAVPPNFIPSCYYKEN